MIFLLNDRYFSCPAIVIIIIIKKNSNEETGMINMNDEEKINDKNDLKG